MKIIIILFILLHGFIHSMGFLSSFRLAQIEQLQSISKPVGIIWLIAALLFLTTGISLLFNQEWWWMLAILSVIVSQMLIVLTWQEAKFGTIANIIILIIIISRFIMK